MGARIAALVVFVVALVACKKEAPPAPPRHATLLFVADMHAQLETHPELLWDQGAPRTIEAGGYARLATAARSIRDEVGGRALLIDGGDTFQGAAVAAWSQGEAIVGPQRALGVDFGIPGNWEVVYGAAQMKKLASECGYPWLATNVVDEATGALVFPPTAVKDVGGLRVGLIGLTDPDVPIRQSPAYSRGLKYLGEETIAPAVQSLREKDHADVVVLVTHVGLARSVGLAERVPGIDVVLSADTHERSEKPIVKNGVLVVEPGSFASFLGRLDVDVAPGEKPRFAWKLVTVAASAYAEAPDVKQAVDAALAPYRDRASRPIGRAAAPLERYGVVETTADDVLTAAVKSQTHVDIALSNGFRFGTPITPGPITEADLWSLYPVVSNVKTATVTGAQLRAFWESELDHVFADDPRRLFGGWVPRVDGMSVTFRARGESGHRVDRVLVNGAPLDDAKTYTIAACEREGDPDDVLCRIKGVSNAKRLDVTNHDVVRAYLASPAAASGVGGPTRGDVRARDLSPEVFSQWAARLAPSSDGRVFRARSLEADLPRDPAEAELVRRGARIFRDTKQNAAAYVGNDLSCESCHLDGGQREGALPLVGAEAMYPSFQKRAGRLLSIEERIQGCFERSENGKAPPEGSDVLAAVAAYVRWLSDGEARDVDPPWRAKNRLDESRRLAMNELHADEGERVYAAKCASCHGLDGQGVKGMQMPNGAPPPTPLWGPRSYNDGAGLARVYTLAGFLRWAMPFGSGGTLGDEEAQHVAAFLDGKDRPPFARKGDDYPDGGPPVDALYYPSVRAGVAPR